MSAPGGVQTLRLRKPDAAASKPATKSHHTGILQDQVRRSARAPWTPSFSMAVRLLLLVRVTAAMYSNISDCDEVYNFWEPLHYLDKGYGFQTWETSPAYSIRSWAYILLHLLPVRIARFITPEKRPAFFAVRIALAIVSTLCEARMYRTVVEKINLRVGRYFFFMLLFSAGMWNASTAFLPSSFALYTTTLAYAYALEAPSRSNQRRTLLATVIFAAGAIVGWPFSLALAIPFVFEELFVLGADRIISNDWNRLMMSRWTRLFGAGALAASIFIPVVGIDTFFYGRTTVTPLNIIVYNIFPETSRGPELYGTEPASFYVLNLLLNFNILLPLALASLPALWVTYTIDRKRLYAPQTAPAAPGILQSSPYTVLALRLAPFYVWLGILTAQPHKEERFMFPAYSLLCLNAAVTLYLVRGWLEVAYIKVTKSPYQASRTPLFRLTTLSVILYAAFISISRVLALWHYYHAPLSVIYRLETTEVPSLLNATGLVPFSPPPSAASPAPPVPEDTPSAIPSASASEGTYGERRRAAQRVEEQQRKQAGAQRQEDIAAVRALGLRLCVGKEWYRFPGHYLVPDGIDVRFIKSDFDGLVPGKFAEAVGPTDKGGGLLEGIFDRKRGTGTVPKDQNDRNEEEMSHYVDVSTCDYLLDLDFPGRRSASEPEPPYAISAAWQRAHCAPFLDAARSSMLTRALWLPGERWQRRNEWGEWCLLRNADLLSDKSRIWQTAGNIRKAREVASTNSS